MSRASLVKIYVESLPFAAVAIVPTPDGCRLEVGGSSAPTFFFKPTHIELVLAAAGLSCGPIDEGPGAVAVRLLEAAKSLGAPSQTAADLRADAEQQVDKIVAKVAATNQAGGLTELNRQYREYRLAQVAKAERAMQYRTFLEQRYTAKIVRSVASVGRMI